jgi:putative membrane protein
MKNHGFLYRFLVRWFVCGLGLWIAAGLLGSHVQFVTNGSKVVVVIVAGLILAVINAIIKPLVVLLSLPAILLTLVLLASWLYSPLHVTNFWGAMLAGVIIGLVNYLVTAILESGEK